jgi:transcription initiation protein SPT3
LIFLIRHDTKKVNRLKHFLSWKEVRKNVKDKGGGGVDDAEEMMGEEGGEGGGGEGSGGGEFSLGVS